jgi:hypothetical protein
MAEAGLSGQNPFDPRRLATDVLTGGAVPAAASPVGAPNPMPRRIEDAVGGSGLGPFRTWDYQAATTPVPNVLTQSTPDSCGAASVEILSGGRVTEADILARRGDQNVHPGILAEEMGDGWQGRWLDSEQEALDAASQGPAILRLQAPGEQGHFVVSEPLPNGNFRIQNPGIGGSYEVTPQWIRNYASAGVFQEGT